MASVNTTVLFIHHTSATRLGQYGHYHAVTIIKGKHPHLQRYIKREHLIFERMIMRKIFSPTRTDDGYWRIKTN